MVPKRTYIVTSMSGCSNLEDYLLREKLTIYSAVEHRHLSTA